MENKLFMALLGCRPEGRLTEQHDIFFGIGKSLKELVPHMNAFWPEAKGRIHIDAWREVTAVDGHRISVVPKPEASALSLYFVNLGGYRPGEFEEFHYKILAVGDMPGAVKKAKETAFYKHSGFTGAVSHIDDKFGIDVDDLYRVDDLLGPGRGFGLRIIPEKGLPEDISHIGYAVPGKL